MKEKNQKSMLNFKLLLYINNQRTLNKHLLKTYVTLATFEIVNKFGSVRN